MFPNVYGDKRALIVCGKYEGMGKKCADYIYGELAPVLPYVLTICEAKNLTEEQKKYYSLIVIGTKEDNSCIAELCENGIISVPSHKDGYRIKVCDNPDNSDRQLFVLAGGGDTGAYYAGVEFANKYLNENTDKDHDLLPENEGKGEQSFLFGSNLPEVDYEEIHAIEERGIWTWGHVIYDYKKFLDNMAFLRMNVITVWNDFVPINVKDFTDYAHSLGIKVIWGISIGWGYDYDISKDSVLDEIIEGAVENYRQNYKDLNADGVYFQTFTETKEDSRNGVNIAERVAMFVNKIGVRFREEFGDIRIQFGLHASSITEHLDKIKTISTDIEIVYEDAGAFPFQYIPERISEFDETMEFTNEITTLRPGEHFGAVLKGMSTLPWRTFEHQMDTFNMGVYGKRFVAEKAHKKRTLWRRRNAMWIKNGEYAREMYKLIVEKTKGKALIQHLIENAAFEESISFASSLISQLMWNPNRKFTDLLYEAAQSEDIDF